MFALLNILYLLLPISQTGSEVGVNLILGSNLEYTNLADKNKQTYFYNDKDLQIGFHYGLGAYYNYYLDNYYIGLKTSYKHLNTTFREYEPELINIDGQAVDGEFEHYFDYNIDVMNLTLGGGYRISQQFTVGLGFLYSLPLSDYSIHSKETIVKPTDAGVFKEEGTRIRNEKRYSIPSVSSKFGAMVELGGLFPMNRNETIFLKPSITYSYLFTNNLENLDSWKTDFIDILLGVSFALGENEVLGEKNKIIEPEFTMAIFELNGNTESTIRKAKIDYVVANNLQTSKSVKLITKFDNKLVVYVGIKNKLKRIANFMAFVEDKQKYKLDNLQESNRLEINLSGIVNSTDQNEIEFKVVTNDGFGKTYDLPLEFNKSGELNYIISKNENEILDYLKHHQTEKFELYTDDRTIYRLLNTIKATNITVLPKENFPCHFAELATEGYLLIAK